MVAAARATGIVATAALLLCACATPHSRALDAASDELAPPLGAPALPRLGALPALPYALPGGARPLPPMARPLLPASPMAPSIASTLLTPPWIFVILASTLAWNQAPLFGGI